MEMKDYSASPAEGVPFPNEQQGFPVPGDNDGEDGGSLLQESPRVSQNVEVSVLPTLQLSRKRQHPQTGIIEEVAIHCSAENSDVLVSVAEWVLQNQDRLEFAKDNSKRGGGQ